MCFSCEWSKYRHLIDGGDEYTQIGMSRRKLLLSGALLSAVSITPGLGVYDVFAEKNNPGYRKPIGSGDESANIVFINGKVYTVNEKQPWAEAVAVRGKSIVYVGGNTGLDKYIGEKTLVIDLAGKMLMPGFIEGHIHPIPGATVTRGVDLQYDTREETLSALNDYKKTAGKVNVVRGFGWRYNAFPASGPNKEDLDKIWPDTPVFLIAIDGHSAWVNSKTLELANVTKDTKDPKPGFSYIQREPETGEPTGYLVEPPAMFQVMNAVGPFTGHFIRQSLEEWLPKASAAGITSVFDAGTILLPEEQAYQIYMSLAHRDELPLRVVGTLYHNDPKIDPIPKFLALRKQFQSELVSLSFLKLNIDGGEAQYTAALLAPYADRPDTNGETLLSTELYKDIVCRADLNNINIHVHTFGDRATRLSLDAIEHAIEMNPDRERRNALAHLYLVNEKDRARFKKLNVIAQFSPQWAVPDKYWRGVSISRVGEERASQSYPVGSVLRQGARISFGSDWPAAGYYSTFRPLEEVEIALTRRELNNRVQMPLPPEGECIGLSQALHAVTLGPAYQMNMESKIGSIEVGKFADLIVLEKNIFDIPNHEIHKTRVLMTIMNGRIRHSLSFK